MRPHAVITAGVNVYGYDANGNQITRTIGVSVSVLTYDAENRLTTVSGATSASFVYDGDGNRVKATFGTAPATSYVGSHVEWITSTTTMVKYYYAGGQRERCA